MNGFKMLERLKNMEWVSLAKGAAIAGSGAALTYAGQWASGQDFGLLAPTVAAGLAIAVNFVRKLAAAHDPEINLFSK
jgi:hypothetical protein